MKQLKPRLGIYAGSFDPFHIGHMDIVSQATNVFDEVLVAKGTNTLKDTGVRYSLPAKYLGTRFVKTDYFDGLLTDFIKDLEAKEVYSSVTLIRGLRNGADLEYERNFLAFLKSMLPTIQVVTFLCDPKYQHVSSSALRAIEKISTDEFLKYVIIDGH